MVTRLYRNGQTTHVFTLCAELLRQGHHVFLLVSPHHDPIDLQWLQQTGIPYATTLNLTRLSKYLAQWRPQIIHNHSAHTISAAITLSRLLQIPIVTTVHYLDFAPVDLLAKQDAVIFISSEMKANFEYLPVPTFVIENGIPLPQGHPTLKPWQRQALFLAQVTPEKEENFQMMSESLLAWGWQVTSAGNWRHKGIQNLGWVKEVQPLLRHSNLVIGTGRAVREGMAAGCAVWVLGAYSDGLVTPNNVGLLQQTNFSGRSSKKPFCPEKAAKPRRPRPSQPG